MEPYDIECNGTTRHDTTRVRPEDDEIARIHAHLADEHVPRSPPQPPPPRQPASLPSSGCSPPEPRTLATLRSDARGENGEIQGFEQSRFLFEGDQFLGPGTAMSCT